MTVGVALKVEDGSKRAAEPAILAVLRRIDAIGAAELELAEQIRGAGTPQHPQEIVGHVRTVSSNLKSEIRDPRSERSP